MWKLFRKKSNNESNIEIKGKLPKHIAIIMDGNGRWAKARNLPRSFGHKAGVEAIRDIVKECNNIGIKYLTLYAFSTENWVRPADEVNTLMKLLVEYLKNEVKELHQNNVVVNFIGDISRLPMECQAELIKAHERTKNNTGVIMNLALNYGGRNELIHVVKSIVKEARLNKITENDIDEKIIGKYLYTANMPDPDIIVRSSGEMRLSNFLLWQSAYSELWFSDIYWPDFKKEDLHKVIYDYQNRDRRFGGVKK